MLMKLLCEFKVSSYVYVIKMLFKVYVELEDWDSLCELLLALKKYKVVSEDVFS